MDPQHRSFAAVAKAALSLGISKSEGKGVRHEVRIKAMDLSLINTSNLAAPEATKRSSAYQW